VIMAILFVKVKIDELRPYVAPRIPSHDVIYYSGDELPRTEDLGGSETGVSGRAGGDEAHHRTQTIKIARGGSLTPQVVDAPNLKLPSSRDAVANLLAIKPDAGPPPAEGLRSTRTAPNLTATLVAPSPNVIRDYTRNGIQMDPVAPPQNITRSQPLTAPNLNAILAPPAPNVADDHKLIAPVLTPVVAAPAPNISRDRTTLAPSLNAAVAPPSQNVSRDPFRTAPSLATNVAAPAPSGVTRQYSAAPVRTMDAVVPPPVSAPERTSTNAPRMTLPAPSTVAPPPSTDVTADMRRLSGGNVPDPAKVVVPPPPTNAGSGSFLSGLIGRILGPSEVVAPPASVNANNSGSGGTRPALQPNVAPPPAATSGSDPGGNVRGNRNGTGTTLSANVAPPPSVGLSGATGNPSRPASAPYLGNPSVVPPPPTLGGAGGGTGTTAGGAGAPGGHMLGDNVVPPPPSVNGGSSSVGSGRGRQGNGLGAPLDIGSTVAPPANGGSGNNTGAVISNQPGTKIGLPPAGSKGSLAMSPAGGDKPGLGGNGGGTGTGSGPGPGSGMAGNSTGAGRTGSGRGIDPDAHGGISPTNGPGGAGSATSGTPAIPGVDIRGGNQVTVSFDDGTATSPTASTRTPIKGQKHNFQAEAVGTGSAGGAFEPYKNLLRGEKHTHYIDTSAGTVVMEYVEKSPGGGAVLAQPEELRVDLPEGLPHARLMIACDLDASGNLKNLKVLDPGPAAMTAKVLAALSSWKFQPAMRGTQSVELTAILGFGIDTNDRF